ncbi:MAG: hypothetical protein IAX21_00505 [Candidatus Bathyarchaeota archaeon]|nr:hypothetical protein [Candidatus Bathyarchaeum tardum]WGM90540.1 MAG: hypothetical protein NUK63_05300 [Candidatus Bathyarchaeum tardum]WNZ30493.1 MAG: hypothetical protein IAX21_00505 [Candidatus Bathyarchaeota archaeon]
MRLFLIAQLLFDFWRTPLVGSNYGGELEMIFEEDDWEDWEEDEEEEEDW